MDGWMDECWWVQSLQPEEDELGNLVVGALFADGQFGQVVLHQGYVERKRLD